MTDKLLIAILVDLLLIACLLWRILGHLAAIYCAQSQSTEEITEALWAKMGMSASEWRERNAEARVADFNRNSKRSATQR